MEQIENKGIHIRTIQASKAFEHSERGEYVKADYTGMMPYSLLTIKLDTIRDFKKRMVVSEGTKKNPIKYKYLTDDLINIKFDHKVYNLDSVKNTYKEDIKNLKKYLKKASGEKEINKLNLSLEHKTKRLNEIKDIDVAENKAWDEKSTGFLRNYLYEKGFTFDGVKYVQFMRSSSKSRKGECLFIKESLLQSIQKWTRLGFEIEKDSPIDLVSLRAYESLCSSGIQSTINIDVNSILLVDDIKSTFPITKPIKVVRVGEDGKLKVDIEKPKGEETLKLTNDIFDGESLLDYEFFEDKDYSFILTRNIMFKSALFSFNIQEFMNDHCPEDIDFDEWTLTDMYGNEILAKDVRMITTPNSCKFLKLSYLKTEDKSFINYKDLSKEEKMVAENAMYQEWKQKVIDDGQVFGVCKNEKESMHTFNEDDEGSVHRLSYQILNTLISDKAGIEKLSEEEREYIKKLQNNENNEEYIAFLELTSTDNNSNQLYIDLFKHNSDFANTKMFREYKYTTINSYKKKLKKGAIHISGADYAVMCSCPVELALWSIKRIDNKNIQPVTLKGDQVYSKLYPFGEELTAYRNPHSSSSSIYRCTNVHNEMIEKYMPNLTNNVMVVTAIGNYLQETTGGSDFDSDSLLLCSNKELLNLTVDDENIYPTVVSDVGQKQSTAYTYSDSCMAIVDSRISKSGSLIGEVANLGCLAFSVHQHLKSKGNDEEAKKVLALADLICILQTCVIDMAKKEFEIRVQSEISSIRKTIQNYLKKISPLKLNKIVSHKSYKGIIDKSVKYKAKSNIIYKPMFFKFVEEDKLKKEKKLKRLKNKKESRISLRDIDYILNGNAPYTKFRFVEITAPVDKKEKVKVKYISFNTPMDYLQDIIDDTKSESASRTIKLNDLLVTDIKRSDANWNQLAQLKEIAKGINADFIKLNADKVDKEDSMRMATNLNDKYIEKLSKLKVKKETIYTLVDDMFNKGKIRKSSKMIKLLLYTHPNEFYNIFVKK